MKTSHLADEYGLSGKVAIVTGAGGQPYAQDIECIANGQAAALLLARAGATICVVGRSPDTLNNTVEWIKKEGGEAFAHRADVSIDSDCKTIVEACMDLHGRVDCLDNNAAKIVAGNLLSLDIQAWRGVFDTNVQSIISMSKYTIEKMVKGGSGGSIVSLSSLSAIRPTGHSAYGVSKGTVISLTKAIAREHGADGIRANSIILGPAYTPMSAKRLDPEAREKRKEASLLKREGTGWDTANLVRFLCSRQSAWMTGQAICLDGGTSIMGPDRSINKSNN